MAEKVERSGQLSASDQMTTEEKSKYIYGMLCLCVKMINDLKLPWEYNSVWSFEFTGAETVTM